MFKSFGNHSINMVGIEFHPFTGALRDDGIKT